MITKSYREKKILFNYSSIIYILLADTLLYFYKSNHHLKIKIKYGTCENLNNFENYCTNQLFFSQIDRIHI